MESKDAAAIESAWLEVVGERLAGQAGSAIPAPSDADVRALLRVTKITADVTGVRYLAPLTSFMMGVAAGRAGAEFDMPSAVDEISALAEGWTPPESPG